MAKQGRLDAMVNAVGGYAAGANLWETDPKVFEQMFVLNFRPGSALARAVAPAMVSKWPKPQEIARVILFLCSDDAELIQGTSITV
jgi:NAD(P)-dependent dehydrogenase (short-subunit alcohol dehydrogenase family)